MNLKEHYNPYIEDTEVWKPISNYEVSSLGKVRNKRIGRILKPSCKGGWL